MSVTDATCGMGPGPDGSSMLPMGCGDLHSTSTLCLVKANARMHAAMAIEFGCGDSADADFFRGMIPHHQGAIDMCKILLKLGDPVDPSLRVLCTGWDQAKPDSNNYDYLRGVMHTQQWEIDDMVSWLRDHGYDNGTLCSATTASGGSHGDHGAESHGMGGMDGTMGDAAAAAGSGRLDDAQCGIPARQMDTGDTTLKFGWMSTIGGPNFSESSPPAAPPQHGRALMEDAGAGAHSPSPQQQQQHNAHEDMVMGCGNMSCLSSRCFLHANQWMHDAMSIEYTGDVNVDFVHAMLPHHQGAVDMCRIMVKAAGVADEYSLPNLNVRQICVEVIAHQSEEIQWMTRWLHDRGLSFTRRCSQIPSSEGGGSVPSAQVIVEAGGTVNIRRGGTMHIGREL